MAKTVVGLFDTAAEAQRVVDDLTRHGIPRENVSVMAPHIEGRTSFEELTAVDEEGARVVTGAGIGATVGGVGGLLVGLAVLPIPGFGPVLAMGPIATTLAGMGIGAATGSLIGALTAIGVPEEHAEHFAEGVRRGGTLVSVNAPDALATEVSDLMNRHGAVNIHERAASWRVGDGGTDNLKTRPMVSPRTDVGKYTMSEPTPQPVTRTMPLDVPPFREGTVEFKEHLEVPVVAQNSRLIDEVVVQRDVPFASPRADVGITPFTAAPPRSYGAFESDYRADYQRRFATSGVEYVKAQPAYRFGYDLANDPQYAGRDWNTLEADAHRAWAFRGTDVGPWERFKDAVRFAWDHARGERRSLPSQETFSSLPTQRSSR